MSAKLLAAEVSDLEQGGMCSRCEKAITGENSSGFSYLKLFLVFFLCQIPVLGLSFLTFHNFQTNNVGPVSRGIDQQDCKGFLVDISCQIVN